MSVRVVVQAVAIPAGRVAPRRRWVKHRQPGARELARSGSARLRWWARFQDDRDLVGVKLALVCAMLLIVMALEVPH